MHCVALVFIVEGLALCHHMGTQALDPSSVLDYWLPAENMFTLDFYCAERGLEPKFDQNGSLKKNSQEGTDRQTMVLPALRVLFTETIRRGKVALHGDRSRDRARQMTRSRSVAGGWQGSLPLPKYHPNAPPLGLEQPGGGRHVAGHPRGGGHDHPMAELFRNS